jgi:hypothetical protein
MRWWVVWLAVVTLLGCERASVDASAVERTRAAVRAEVSAGARVVSRSALSAGETVTVFIAPYSDGVLVQRIPCVVYRDAQATLMHCASPEIGLSEP